jgi:hypothetical protein
MKTKHTTGQWKYSGLTIYAHKVTETQDSRKIIALIDPKRGEPSEENEANAKLIASAPDLLETLQSVADFYSAKIEQTKGAEQFNWECRLKDVQKVIDKATK